MAIKKEIQWETNEQGCQLVTSHRIHQGYPYIKRDGKSWRMHRWLWTEKHGDIPEGMVLLHSCDNPRCINLEHLSLGTQADNIADMIAKGRGPQLTGDNNINRQKKLIVKNNIKKYRKEKKLTVEKLANELGIHKGHLSNIENQKRSASLELMKNISTILRVSIDTLLEDV
jgi:DNA-binding XRE family transcriptional regulator